MRAKEEIAGRGNVFLIDHAITFRYPELRMLLRQNPKIVERLEYMLKYQGEKSLPQEEKEETKSSDLEL